MNQPVASGILWGIGSTFPCAAITALFYGFPVPLVGRLHGVEGMIASVPAVLAYGLMAGGFLVVGATGALSGYVASRWAEGDEQRAVVWTRFLAIACTAMCVGTLAILHLIIGPW